MAGRKRRRAGTRVLEVSLQGSDLRRIPYRVTIEGSHWSRNPHQLKNEIRDAIVDAANALPGAEVLLVGTRHSDETGVSKSGKIRKPKPKGTIREEIEEDEDEFEEEEEEERPAKELKGRVMKPDERRVAALRSNHVRYGWSDEQFVEKLKEHGLMGAAQRMGYFDENGRVAPAPANFEEHETVRLRLLRVKRMAEKQRWSKARTARAMAAARMGEEFYDPQGSGRRPKPKVVEVLPNGTKVYSDGSRVTPSGRHLSPETVRAFQEGAKRARARRHVEEQAAVGGDSNPFPAPPGDSEARPQEVLSIAEREAITREDSERERAMEIPEFARGEEFPTEVAAPEPPPPAPIRHDREQPRPFGEMPRRGGGVIRKVLGWHSSDAPPRITDLPEQTEEEWWDNIVRAYLLPDTDPEALCHNNHITRAQLDHELERRGIRPYAGVAGQMGPVKVPPPRMH